VQAPEVFGGGCGGGGWGGGARTTGAKGPVHPGLEVMSHAGLSAPSRRPSALSVSVTF